MLNVTRVTKERDGKILHFAFCILNFVCLVIQIQIKSKIVNMGILLVPLVKNKINYFTEGDKQFIVFTLTEKKLKESWFN